MRRGQATDERLWARRSAKEETSAAHAYGGWLIACHKAREIEISGRVALPGPISGTCLCGTIAFVIDGKYGRAGQCHCSKCRKVSGTDGNAVFYAARESFHWLSGETNIATYRIAGPAGWRSTFCRTCGSPLPYMDSAEKFYFVPAGLLDDDPGFRGYAAHIFVGSKAPWVCITDDAPQYVEGFGSEQVAR